MADVEKLFTGLRAWTKDHDAHVKAAVELLIWHEHWLRRPDFTAAAVERYGKVMTIDWNKARSFMEDARGSTSEVAVLDLAITLAQDRFRLRIMGDAHSKAIVRAFASALGIEPPEAVRRLWRS